MPGMLRRNIVVVFVAVDVVVVAVVVVVVVMPDHFDTNNNGYDREILRPFPLGNR